MRYTSYELTRLSVLTALALALSVTESIFFPAALFPVPGMRLGLVNVVTLIAVGGFVGRSIAPAAVNKPYMK